MKRIPLTITMRPEYKRRLKEKAEEAGLSIGQYIERVIDKEDEKLL